MRATTTIMVAKAIAAIALTASTAGGVALATHSSPTTPREQSSSTTSEGRRQRRACRRPHSLTTAPSTALADEQRSTRHTRRTSRRRRGKRQGHQRPRLRVRRAPDRAVPGPVQHLRTTSPGRPPKAPRSPTSPAPTTAPPPSPPAGPPLRPGTPISAPASPTPTRTRTLAATPTPISRPTTDNANKTGRLDKGQRARPVHQRSRPQLTHRMTRGREEPDRNPTAQPPECSYCASSGPVIRSNRRHNVSLDRRGAGGIRRGLRIQRIAEAHEVPVTALLRNASFGGWTGPTRRQNPSPNLRRNLLPPCPTRSIQQTGDPVSLIPLQPQQIHRRSRHPRQRGNLLLLPPLRPPHHDSRPCWRASQIPDTGPNKVRPGTEDDRCGNGVGSSRPSSRTRP